MVKSGVFFISSTLSGVHIRLKRLNCAFAHVIGLVVHLLHITTRCSNITTVQTLHKPEAMIEAARTSETSVNFYQTTRRYNPEESHLRFVTCLSHKNTFEINLCTSLRYICILYCVM
jgi:hypothetical protein